MYKIRKIHPMFNMVITTMNEYRDVVRESGLIDTTRSNRLKEYQTVVAVGPNVHNIKPGDVVFINPRRYAKMTHKDGLKDLDANVQKTDMFYQLDIPTVDVYDQPDGSCRTLLAIYDNDIEFIAEGEEFDEVGGLYTPPKPELIHPDVSVNPHTKPLYTPDYAKKKS